jgi:DNA-binding NtrC family response regulator
MMTLVVEDDVILAERLREALADWGALVDVANTVDAALKLLSKHHRLIVFDVRLPDGSGLDVAKGALELRPAPLLIAISGQADRQEAFKLGRMGVRGLLDKPIDLLHLGSIIEHVLEDAPRLSADLCALVGQKKLHDVLDEVRRTMLEQALALSRGNRTEAARMVGLTRQRIQQSIKEMGLSLD